MKNFCRAVSLFLFFALFANAQEEVPLSPPLPPPNDSSVVEPQPTPPQEVFAPVAPPPAPPPAAKAPEPAKPDYQKNLRMVAYLHPIPLFYGAANDLFMFSATLELPLNLNNSVVIQPVIWLGSSNGFFEDVNVINALSDDRDEMRYEKLKRFGSSFGIRHYILERNSGFYLQAVAGLYYISAESLSYNKFIDTYYEEKPYTYIKVKGAVAELMLYAGLAHKWQNISLAYEIGLGFGYDGTNTHQLGYINSLATNFNLCLGIPF